MRDSFSKQHNYEIVTKVNAKPSAKKRREEK